MFCKKVLLKISQNSHENSCAKVSFTCTFNENEALTQVVPCEFCEIGLTSKYKRQMCTNISQENVYLFCVYLNQTCCNKKKNLFSVHAAVVSQCD